MSGTDGSCGRKFQTTLLRFTRYVLDTLFITGEQKFCWLGTCYEAGMFRRRCPRCNSFSIRRLLCRLVHWRASYTNYLLWRDKCQSLPKKYPSSNHYKTI